jgi:glycosyltransferase involved in cell wall biosynthesis
MDDRVFYHQAKSLNNNDFQIHIISTKEELSLNTDGIIISSYNDKLLTQKQKFEKIIDKLNSSTPDIIICDSPISVLASSIYRQRNKVKVIYDITEWYPSKNNLAGTKGLTKFCKAIALILINLLAGVKADGFIFGEHYKSIPFRVMFFLKKNIFLPYYPNLEYIKYFPIRKDISDYNFLYSGVINKDKGIYSVIRAIRLTAKRFPTSKLNLRIIGDFQTSSNREYYEELCAGLESNINIQLSDFMAFPEFCKVIGEADIFFDLRKIEFENTYSLPIKLFYYLACGRPVIYSNLKAIKKVIPDFNVGYLCDPLDIESIAECISECISSPKVYKKLSSNALDNSKSIYNWGHIESKFITFIESF